MKNVSCVAANFFKSTGRCELGTADQALLEGELVVNKDAVHYSTLLCTQQKDQESSSTTATNATGYDGEREAITIDTDCGDNCKGASGGTPCGDGCETTDDHAPCGENCVVATTKINDDGTPSNPKGESDNSCNSPSCHNKGNGGKGNNGKGNNGKG